MTANKRILVTGGTGVIGAWAVRDLAEAGHSPIVLTRGLTSVGRAILGDVAGHVEWVEVDLQHQLALMDAVHRVRPDVIAHLASAKPWQMDAGYVERPDPPLGVRTIINGTVNLLEIARSLDIERVVFAGSKSAYAPFAGAYGPPEYRLVPETYPSRPVEVYGITKLAAEQLGRYYRDFLGVDFVSLRFASTYGPFKRGAGIAPAGLIGAAIEGRTVTAIYGETAYSQLLDEFVYNRDIGRAIRLACEVPSTESVMFNIGTGVGSSIQDVVEAIRSVDGVASPDVTVRSDSDEQATGGHLVARHAGILDPSLARAELGFVAEFDLRAGIEDAARLIRETTEELPAL
jgi:UDP-glucose 4-epimerase